MSDALIESSIKDLDSQNIKYKLLRHAPVMTAVEHLKVAGAFELNLAKNIFCKADKTFALVVARHDADTNFEVLKKVLVSAVCVCACVFAVVFFSD